LDPLQRVLGDAQVAERILSVRVRLEIDAEAGAPSRHLGGRDRYLGAALTSAPAHHGEGERVLAEVEERLGFDAKFISPYLLELSQEDPNPIVPLIDAA